MSISITLARVRFNAERIGLSSAKLARIVGVSAGTLSNAFNDVGRLSSVQESELDTVVSRLMKFRDAIAPLELPRDWESLRELTITPVTPDDASEFVEKIFTISKQQ